jgi:hypothetical protein
MFWPWPSELVKEDLTSVFILLVVHACSTIWPWAAPIPPLAASPICPIGAIIGHRGKRGQCCPTKALSNILACAATGKRDPDEIGRSALVARFGLQLRSS